MPWAYSEELIRWRVSYLRLFDRLQQGELVLFFLHCIQPFSLVLHTWNLSTLFYKGVNIGKKTIAKRIISNVTSKLHFSREASYWSSRRRAAPSPLRREAPSLDPMSRWTREDARRRMRISVRVFIFIYLYIYLFIWMWARHLTMALT